MFVSVTEFETAAFEDLKFNTRMKGLPIQLDYLFIQAPTARLICMKTRIRITIMKKESLLKFHLNTPKQIKN